jgi:Rne/Rng family ribonuclease
VTRQLVVERTLAGVRGAVLADGLLTDLHDLDAFAPEVEGTLFAARVTAVDQRLGAAFLDIGTALPAFLTAKDARHRAGTAERRPIQTLVREGERLLVQGLREPEAGKGARVTTDLKLMGFHLVWRPHGPVGAERAARGAGRQALQERGAALFGDQPVSLRKLAAIADDACLEAELASLRALAERLAREAAAARPGPLHVGGTPVERLLRLVAAPDLARIAVADPALLASLRPILEGPLAGVGCALERLDPDRAAFAQAGVADQLDALTGREVPVPGGARLLVEPTAAGIVVDVDGGGGTALEVNLAAAAVLARVLRVRNLGGTVLVDFVDLARPQDRQRLEDGLKRALRDDPQPVDVYPISPLGIVQLSRARRGRSLDAVTTRACPTCDGSGRVASLRACAEALDEAVRRTRPPAVRVRVAPDLHGHLTGAAAAAWRHAHPAVALAADRALAPGGFDLEQRR